MSLQFLQSVGATIDGSCLYCMLNCNYWHKVFLFWWHWWHLIFCPCSRYSSALGDKYRLWLMCSLAETIFCVLWQWDSLFTIIDQTGSGQTGSLAAPFNLRLLHDYKLSVSGFKWWVKDMERNSLIIFQTMADGNKECFLPKFFYVILFHVTWQKC